MLSWRGPGHPNYGGAEISTYHHIRAWVKAGHQVYWFTSSVLHSPSEETIDGVHIIRRGFQILQVHSQPLSGIFSLPIPNLTW